ncbi:MAG: Gfo/Idh/MocA family oxidoreductase [Candidatus Symbiothrix sp.]|jgi:predicted dehydrogenase|nr:Gfo/Idh/MocA family oxidoreductase [Candidatus Symbiothrix sp.]
MTKAAIIGLGKMGLSHCSILGAHPDVDLVAVCDSSSLIQDAFKKLTKTPVYSDYKKMIEETKPECLFVVTPTKYHFEMVVYALERGIHVFCEKPFSLNVEEGQKMVNLVQEKNLVNQVGYHNRFIGTFNEMKRLLEHKILGDCYHFLGEAYGPVVLKEKGETWRAERAQGGGCLFDYASHVLNLVYYIIGKPIEVKGTLLKHIYSKEVEDAVYASIILENGLTGQLSVNWSDDTYRKMSTSIRVEGKNGKMIADATELKIYLKEENKKEGLPKGWSVKYITDLTPQVNFNLRGEEYSSQVDYFIDCIKHHRPSDKSSFATAFATDEIIDKLIINASN